MRKAKAALGADCTPPFTHRTCTFIAPAGSLKHHSEWPGLKSCRAGSQSESGAGVPSGRCTSVSLYSMDTSEGQGEPSGREPGVMTRRSAWNKLVVPNGLKRLAFRGAKVGGGRMNAARP